MGVDDLFTGPSGDSGAVDPATALRSVRLWSMLAGALNYAAFMAGLAILFLRDAELPDGLLRTIWVGCALGSLLAAPGAFVSIWAWIRADEILKQARTGALPEAVGGPAFRARQQAFVLLGVSAVSLVVQIVALQNVLGATGAHQ